MRAMTLPPALRECLDAAQRVVVLTGAGVSAESGVPTFRDAQTGLWAQFKAEELATPRAFQRNPRLVWEWYQWRRALVQRAEPNPAHAALAAWERQVPGFHLITQNIDGLHQRAGSRRLLELHGNIHRVKCATEGTVIDTLAESGELPPRCPRCGGLLRPDVVWFEEPMPERETAEAFRLSAACEVFLAVGTSALVYPAAALPHEAQGRGATVVEINLNPTPLTGRADFVLTGAAGVLLPALLAAAGPRAEGAEGP